MEEEDGGKVLSLLTLWHVAMRGGRWEEPWVETVKRGFSPVVKAMVAGYL